MVTQLDLKYTFIIHVFSGWLPLDPKKLMVQNLDVSFAFQFRMVLSALVLHINTLKQHP